MSDIIESIQTNAIETIAASQKLKTKSLTTKNTAITPMNNDFIDQINY